MIPLANVCINEDEVDAAASVVKSGWIREGERVKEFEEKFASYVGARYAVAVSSGTAALHTALLSLGVKAGDEVIVPSLTCIPPVSMTVLAGAVPVFCDIEPQTYNLDVESVKRMITDKTKAIIPINYAGHPAALDVLSEIAEQHDVCVLNDAAEALGSTFNSRRISAYGGLSIFSFSPNKAITTGEGGMIVTDNGDLAEKARIIKDYGQQPRFHHIMLGHNYHMGELNAALGIAQLKKIDDILTRKRKNAQRLTQKLSGLSQIKPPLELSGCMHTYCLYSVKVKTNALREYLLAKLPEVGVQSRVYFPPMHSSPMLKNFKFRIDRLANTKDAVSTLLSLPTSAALTEDQIQYVSASVAHILDSFFGP